MSSIHEFINNQVNHLPQDFLCSEIKEICIKLNDILNNPQGSDYVSHLKNKKEDIKKLICELFCLIRPNLYLSLEGIFEQLGHDQENCLLIDKKKL